MAKYYKGSSKGGSFKERRSSDLGLRAFKNQQDVIIDSIKLQKEQEKQYSSDYESGLRGVAQTEEWNQKLLNDLEDKIYQNKRDNIKKRADNEIDALEVQAKEYGLKADFWQDFSSTYSKQWGQLAKGAVDLKDRLQANKQIEDFKDSEAFKNFSDIDGSVIDLFVNQMDEHHGDQEQQLALVDMITNLNRFSRVEALQLMKEQIPNLIDNLKAEINKNASKETDEIKRDEKGWNEDTIGVHLDTLSKQLQKQFDLVNTREGRELDDLISAQAGSRIRKQKELTKVRSDTEKKDKAFKHMHSMIENINSMYKGAKDNPELKEKLIKAAMINAYKRMEFGWTYAEGDKGVVKGLTDETPISILTAVAQEYAKYTTDPEKVKKMISLMPTPGNSDVTFGDRYKNKGESKLDDIVEFATSNANKANEKRKKEYKAVKAATLNAKIVDVIKNNDMNTEEGRKLLVQLRNESIGYEEPHNLANAALAFDYKTHNKVSLHRLLDQSIKNGNLKEMMSVIPYLPQEEKVSLQNEIDKVEKFNKVFPKDLLNTTSKSAIDAKRKENSLSLSDDLAGFASEAYSDTIRNHFMEELGRNPDASESELRLYALNNAKDALNSGAGLWRIVKGPDGKATFGAWVTDEKKWVNGFSEDQPKYMGLKQKDFESKLTEKGLQGLLNDKSHGVDWNIIGIDTIDTWLLKTTKGENLPIHPRVEELYRSQLNPGYDGELLSRTKIMNLIIDKATTKREGWGGSDREIPREQIAPGELDRADYYIKKSELNYGEYAGYSASDQMNLGILQWSMGKDTKFPMSKSLENIYTKARETQADPMDYVYGEPSILNYDYFRPITRLTITTERPE